MTIRSIDMQVLVQKVGDVARYSKRKKQIIITAATICQQIFNKLRPTVKLSAKTYVVKLPLFVINRKRKKNVKRKKQDKLEEDLSTKNY